MPGSGLDLHHTLTANPVLIQVGAVPLPRFLCPLGPIPSQSSTVAIDWLLARLTSEPTLTALSTHSIRSSFQKGSYSCFPSPSFRPLSTSCISTTSTRSRPESTPTALRTPHLYPNFRFIVPSQAQLN